MKTEQSLSKHKKSKIFFGKKLMLIAFFFISILLLKAQPPSASITSPVNGATINNRCDFKFCIWDSIGNQNYKITGDSGFYAYPNYNGSTNGPGSLCFNNAWTFSILPGTYTFYLWANPFSSPSIIDSVSIIIADTINDFCSGLTYSKTVSTNSDVTYNVSGLDSNETITLSVLENWSNIIDTAVVSGVSSASLTRHFPYNGIHSTYFMATSSCSSPNDSCGYYSIDTITGSCPKYISFNYAYFQNPSNYCQNTSAGISAYVNWDSLSANGSSTFTVNWGDGTIDIYSIPHNGSIGGGGYFPKQHSYTAPGVYSVFATVSDPDACYNDSIAGIVNVSIPTWGNLSGTVYNDINNNCSQDNGEPGIAWAPIKISQGSISYMAWTDQSGNYSLCAPAGTYLIQINNISAGYIINCNNSLPHNTTVTTGASTIENFAVNCNGFDMAVDEISIWDGFFPGVSEEIYPYVGMLNNACNISDSGQVKMILDPCLQYNSSSWNYSDAPDAIISAATGDTIVWNLNDINDIDWLDMYTEITTCTSAQVGDTACITVMVLPITGDADPTNNMYTRCFEIGVSYDPNNKEVIPMGTGTQGLIPASTPDLTYTVNFQNTGTAPARNIYILDTIDADLDINSMEILSASHAMQPYLLPNKTMKFMFANIMLPDSTHDEKNSHGYVKYRIKPNSGLSGGTEIKNTGYIYFDYNEAVITNTTLNTIATSASIHEEVLDSKMLNVYPNPAKETLFVNVRTSGNNTIVITDVIGKTVKQIKTDDSQTEINISDLQNGVYFVKAIQGNTYSVQKVIVNK